MPNIMLSRPQVASRLGSGQSVDGLTMQGASDLVVKQDRGALTVGAGVLGMGAVDLVDTVASSIPGLSTAFGFERGDINRYALQALDVPGLGDFYHDYKGGVEVASAVYGTIAAELVTRKLTAPAGAFMGALAKLPYARRLAALDMQYANAMQTVRAVDTNLAARGALGAEQYVGRTVVDSSMFNAATGGFSAVTREIGRDVAVSTAKRLGFAKGVRNAAMTEATMAITLNQNGFLYDDSAAQNMTWMALGLGIGGAAEWLHTAYSVRKFVNSDEIRRTFAGALDPEQAEESRLLWHGKGTKPDESSSFLGGLYSDRATNLLVGARQLTESTQTGTTDALELASSRSRLATQQTQMAREELQKLTRRGISSDGFTRFSMDAQGYGNHLDMMTRRDPAAMYGVEQIGGVADDTSASMLHDKHEIRLQERIDEVEERIGGMMDEEGNLLDDADPKELAELQRLGRRLDYESTLTPMVTIDGELMPMSEAEAFAGFKEPDIGFRATEKIKGEVEGVVKTDNHGLWEVKSENPQGSVSLGTDFLYHIPGNKKLDSADHFDIMRTYRLANKAVSQMAQFKGPIPLPKKPDWFQLDMAEELLRRTDGRANVLFPEGMTRDSARIESLVQKAAGIKQWDKVESAKALKAETKGNTYEGQLSKLRLRYNLPKLSAYERGILGDASHPVEDLLRGIGQMDPAEIRSLNLSEVQDMIGRTKRIGDMAPVQGSDYEDMGNSFSFMMDEKGIPLKPLLAYKRPFKVADWTTDMNAERLAAGKMYTLGRLTAPDSAPITRAISGAVIQSPDFAAAARTHELMDTQIQGSFAGAAPQSAKGAIGKSFISSDWRDRDNPILLAATRLRENVNRMARDFMKATIDGAFEGQLSVLANPRNATTKLLLNQFHSFRAGWDVAPKPMKRDDGYYSFLLRPTKDNQERFKALFGREMADKGQILMAPNGKEVVLDELGIDIQARFNKVTTSIAAEKNTILRANGRGEISNLDWYVPPANTDGKFIGFTFGPDNKPVPGMTVVAKSESEFATMRAAMLKKIEDKGLGYTFRTQDEVREFANIWDRVQMDFINPGTTAVQPGKSGTGRLAGSEVRMDAFEESLAYLQKDFLRHSNDIMSTLLREQINSAKAREVVSTEMTGNMGNKRFNAGSRNVYSYYLENLLGKSKLNSPASMIGNFYRSIEGPLDKFLAEATPGASKVWHATNEWINRSNPFTDSDQARKDFQALSSKLGKYMPFESAAKMAEAQGMGATPMSVAKITGGLNQFSAAVLLRMFEVVHPIMNMTGILNASPAIIRNFTPNAGESGEDFARRVGHSATIFDLDDGRSLGTLDMGKVATRAFKKAWSREAHVDYDYMVRRGFLSQEVAEFHRQFGAIDSPGKWKAMFLGDDSQKKKGVLGWVSIMSDKSEDFSRSWAHMTGLEVADSLGIKSMEARHAFAHDLANKTIANYSPQNRPEIFQGALGAPIGLFQSFIMNYYERMFRYVETKDYKSFATQLATQSGLFGVTSIPGWEQFNSTFMNEAEGEEDPTSGLFRKFGSNAGDLLSHGVISNLPKLFGAPGVDLYSRGDVNVRQLQIQNIDSISTLVDSTVPAFNIVSKMYAGLKQGIGLFSEKNPALSTTQLGEVLSNAIANRPIAGMIEQFLAHGNDTDGAGQLVNETVGVMEQAYRLMGVRSQRQSKELEAFYTNKNAMTHKAANDEQLKLFTRSMIRDGNTENLPDVFNQYLKNGGDPRHFRRWMKATYIASTSTRAERQLESAMKDPNKIDQVMRLLDAGVGVSEDEAVGDGDALYRANAQEEPLTQGMDW